MPFKDAVKRKEYLEGWYERSGREWSSNYWFTKAKIKKLWDKYGLTPEQYDAIFAAQGFRCAGCGSDKPNWHHGWTVDHDHDKKKGDPGFVRGILCHNCNCALGHAKDNIDTLRSLVNYLERTNGRL